MGENYTKEEFFYNVYEEMYNNIVKFTHKYANDNRITYDIVQETFLEFYKKIDLLMEHDNYRGWLYITAKNKSLAMCRKQRNIDYYQQEQIENDQLYLLTYYDFGYDTHEFMLLDECKKIFTDREYIIFYQHYIAGYTIKEVALANRLTLGACKMRLHRIVKKFKNTF